MISFKQYQYYMSFRAFQKKVGVIDYETNELIRFEIIHDPAQTEQIVCDEPTSKLGRAWATVMEERHRRLHEPCSHETFPCACIEIESRLLIASQILRICNLVTPNDDEPQDDSETNAAAAIDRILEMVDVESALDRFLKDVQGE